jgi:hypothetical protein
MVKHSDLSHPDIEHDSNEKKFYNLSEIRNLSLESISSDTNSMKIINEDLNLRSVSKRAQLDKNNSKLYFNRQV